MTQKIAIDIQGHPSLEIDPGENLFSALRSASLPISSACEAMGSCMLCRVKVVSGAENLSPPTSIEYQGLGNVVVASDYRLACQVMVNGPATFELKESRKKKKKKNAFKKK